LSRWRVFPLLLTPVFFAGVCDPGEISIVPVLEDRFSFEAGLAGWSVVASDLGSPPGVWSVEASSEQAVTGSESLKLSLDNTGGGAKLFVKRPFDLQPSTDYQIEVNFQLASADAGDLNLWNVVSGATTAEPLDGAALVALGTTANGQATVAGVVWSPRNGTLAVRTGPDSGRVWIALGISATSAFSRSYWIDDVSVVVRLP